MANIFDEHKKRREEAVKESKDAAKSRKGDTSNSSRRSRPTPAQAEGENS